MNKRNFRWPELGIAAIIAFFSLRELGTFPASWADEGLFIIVAKMVATGQGYALPLLEHTWSYPYFLNVGPMLIYPSALSMSLFGISTEAARLPMVLYLWIATALLYLFARRIGGRGNAVWAALLLVTLSAFVNTGKPVLGEIPAFCFLMTGLLTLERMHGQKRVLVTGLLFGIAIMTKITFGLILPALGVAWLLALWKRQWTEALHLMLIGFIACLTYAPWRILEMVHTQGGGLGQELQNFLIGSGGDSTFLYVLRFDPGLLLRLPFLSFGIFLVLGTTGLWTLRARMSRTLSATVATLIALFVLYFLNGFGWYRLLLPGHLLLLPFVPAGAWFLLRKRPGAAVLLLILLAQTYWQLTHRGSSTSTEGREAAAYVMEHYAGRDLIVEQTEVFARLQPDPRWRFLMPGLSFSMPERFRTVSGDLCRIPLLRKLNQDEIRSYPPGNLETAARRYVILRNYPCPYTPE